MYKEVNLFYFSHFPTLIYLSSLSLDIYSKEAALKEAPLASAYLFSF
jgi:hypothetical protein